MTEQPSSDSGAAGDMKSRSDDSHQIAMDVGKGAGEAGREDLSAVDDSYPPALKEHDEATETDPAHAQEEEATSLSRWVGQWWREFLTDQVTPVRLASHVALLLVAGLVLVLSQINLPQWDVTRVSSASSEQAASGPVLAFNQEPVGGSPLQESGVLLRAPVPFTEIPDRPRLGIITYTVQIEDTVLGIAEQFGLNPNSIVWSNSDLDENPFLLAVGQELIILPVDGVYHTVKDGDTVESIAKKYKVEPEKIVEYDLNGLTGINAPLNPGQKIIVPGGDNTPPQPTVRQVPSAPWRAQNMVWPAYGRLTQVYWLPAHPAIDIGAPLGSVVLAAEEGTVSAAGWSTYGYGNYIIVRHYDGFATLYAHLNRIDVSPGDYVARGQQIGTVGSTGRSTGPHLHFEVSLGGRTYNPLLYLP